MSISAWQLTRDLRRIAQEGRCEVQHEPLLQEAAAEIDRLRAELATTREVLMNTDGANARLRAELAAARELLREAIPHLVGNAHWDGVDRIQAHLAMDKTEKVEK
jgi:hypothetical protein